MTSMTPCRLTIHRLALAALLILSGCGGGGGGEAPVPRVAVNLKPHVFAAPAPATADATTPCPQGGGYADGCAGAGHIGSVAHPTFFQGYAAQSGQTFITRPPWNVAGVDYAVGAYTPAASLLDPTVAANLPAGCAYAAGTVSCTGTGSVDIAGFDFSLHGGIKLYIHNTYTGTCTVEDNNFLVTAATDGNGPLVRIDGLATTCSHLIQWNTFDGNYNAVADGLTTYLVAMTGSPSSELVQYNAFLHCPQKCVGHAAANTVVSQFNYVEGLEEGPAHSEWEIYGAGANVNFNSAFNTILEPANVPVVKGTGSYGVAAIEYASSGQVGSFASATIVNNTIVTNTLDGTAGGPGSASAGIEASYATYGAITFANNYMDPTGLLNCYISTSAPTYVSPPTWSGEVNLINATGIGGFTSRCAGTATH